MGQNDHKSPSLKDLPFLGGQVERRVPKPPPQDLPQAEKFFNRDLSWLKFNDRVLNEAADPSVPPLERLRFAAIVSSNLDEFFMIRVAEIATIAKTQPSKRFLDGLMASQVLAQIREHVLRQKTRQSEVLAEILEAMRQNGVPIQTDFPKDEKGDQEILARLPEIEFVFGRSSDPLPNLLGECIHVFFRFPGEYAVATIPQREARLMELPVSGRTPRFALLERWLTARAAGIFPEREVIEAFPFKIIREAYIRYRPDDEEHIEEQIMEGALSRSKARVVRLEVDAPSYSEGALFLATALGLDSAALYRFSLPLDLRALARLYHIPLLEKLRYRPIHPQISSPVRKSKNLFQILQERDILLHHPYDSFDPVVRFLEEAARDPEVTSVAHTMYRTSRESPIMEALKEAVRQGKKVTAYVEIKARFDEINNVRWARDLRQAGVKVVRPLGGFKVHSKLTQVIRREPLGEISYLHLGTGNYHPGTAQQYTDLGLLTSDATLGREISSYFAALAKGEKPSGFQELLVAPGNLHEQILKLIREEIALQKSGAQGHIVAKMNSLVDPDLIEALYEASSAGVKVDILARGICCLRPGIKGMSENIRVLSIIDRFLEHSRIYYFRAGGAEKIYLSSADWMPRNFYTRYEIAFPIKDPGLKKDLWDVILSNSLADNTKAWRLQPDGAYTRLQSTAEGKGVRSQFLFEELARQR